MKYIKILNKQIIFIFSLFIVMALWSCAKTATVTHRAIKPVKQKIYVKPRPIGSFFGNTFHVQNSSSYKRLLEACHRCGTKRLITNIYGQKTYQKFYGLSSNPKNCKKWKSQGYIQIYFSQNTLPTKTTVIIQPKYTLSNSSQGGRWGESFSVVGTARPINRNKGFELILNPTAGLGGLQSLTIRSEFSNHIKNNTLDVDVMYGGHNSSAIFSQTLPKIKRAVKKSQVDCHTYTT